MGDAGWRVGIIGAGRVGVDWHLPDIRIAGGVVTALSDSVPGRAERLAKANSVGLAFDHYADLLVSPDVDIVAICTPPMVHEEIAVAALEAGKHVYLEKPPTLCAAEMARITQAARRTGMTLMSGSNSIYFDETQALKRRIDAGDLGDIYLIEALKGLRRNYPRGWHRIKAVAGGGVGMDSVPHRLDLVLYLLGTPDVISVTARTYDAFADHALPDDVRYLLRDVEEGLAPQMPVSQVEDTLIAMIQIETGCTLLIRDAAVAHMPENLRVSFYGTRGGARLQPLTLYGEDELRNASDTTLAIPHRPGGAHVLAYRHLFDCLDRGIDTQSPGERSVALMRIVDAIYKSAAQGGRQVRMAS